MKQKLYAWGKHFHSIAEASFSSEKSSPLWLPNHSTTSHQQHHQQLLQQQQSTTTNTIQNDEKQQQCSSSEIVPVPVPLPTQITESTTAEITQISTGVDHGLLLTSDGQVFGVGRLSSQQAYNNCYNNDDDDDATGVFCYLSEFEANYLTNCAVNDVQSLFITGDGSLLQCGINITNYHSSHQHNASSCFSSSSSSSSDAEPALNHSDPVHHYHYPSPQQQVLNVCSSDTDNDETSYFSDSIVSIASGSYHWLVLTQFGRVFSWGRGAFGNLGHGKSDSVSEPCLIRSPLLTHGVDPLKATRIVCIAAAGDHSMLVCHYGRLYAFGNNKNGQLGVGDVMNRFYPTIVKALLQQRVQKVSCGSQFSICLTKQGTVYGMGSNEQFQLGIQSNIHQNHIVMSPIVIQAIQQYKVIDVSCGDTYTAVTTSDKQVFVWGTCGHQYSTPVPTRVSLPIADRIAKMFCGSQDLFLVVTSEETINRDMQHHIREDKEEAPFDKLTPKFRDIEHSFQRIQSLISSQNQLIRRNQTSTSTTQQELCDGSTSIISSYSANSMMNSEQDVTSDLISEGSFSCRDDNCAIGASGSFEHSQLFSKMHLLQSFHSFSEKCNHMINRLNQRMDNIAKSLLVLSSSLVTKDKNRQELARITERTADIILRELTSRREYNSIAKVEEVSEMASLLIERYKADAKESQTTVSELREKLHQVELENTKLLEIQSLNDSTSSSHHRSHDHSRIEKLEVTIDNLFQKVEDSNDLIHRLKQELAHCRLENKRLQHEKEQISYHCKVLNKEVHDLHALREDLESENLDQLEQLVQIKSEINVDFDFLRDVCLKLSHLVDPVSDTAITLSGTAAAKREELKIKIVNVIDSVSYKMQSAGCVDTSSTVVADQSVETDDISNSNDDVVAENEAMLSVYRSTVLLQLYQLKELMNQCHNMERRFELLDSDRNEQEELNSELMRDINQLRQLHTRLLSDLESNSIMSLHLQSQLESTMLSNQELQRHNQHLVSSIEETQGELDVYKLHLRTSFVDCVKVSRSEQEYRSGVSKAIHILSNNQYHVNDNHPATITSSGECVLSFLTLLDQFIAQHNELSLLLQSKEESLQRLIHCLHDCISSVQQ